MSIFFTILSDAILYFSILCSMVTILYIFTNPRATNATFAWIFLVVIFPVIGPILFFIVAYSKIGRLYNAFDSFPDKGFLRKISCKSREYEESNIGREIQRTTGIEPTGVKNLQLFSNTENLYSKMLEDIENAEKFICVEFYVFRPDDIGKQFISALTKKAEEGLKVYLLYDAFGAFDLFLRRRILKKFIKAGGEVSSFSFPLKNIITFSRLNFRNHRKILTIDNKIGYAGGINIGKEYIGTEKKGWYDLHSRLEGDSVYVLSVIFSQDWQYSTGKNIYQEIIKKNFQSSMAIENECVAQVLPSGPTKTDSVIYRSLYTAFLNAKKSIKILNPYLVLDAALLELLRTKAMVGVDITIYAPDKNNQPLSAGAGRFFFEALMEVGVKVYIVKNSMLHAKLSMVDDSWFTIGSANLDIRSLFLNYEVNLAFYSKKYATEIDNIVDFYKSISYELTLEKLKKRGIITKIFDGFCKAISPIL